MEALFLKILNMSIAASWLVIAIFILRLVLKRAPKAMICVFWALVAVRLIFPISFESKLSLIPSAQTVPTELANTETPRFNTGFEEVNNVINPVILESFGDTNEGIQGDIVDNSENDVSTSKISGADTGIVTENENKEENNYFLQEIVHISSIVWCIGIIFMLFYALISYVRIHRIVRESVAYKDNVWLCDRIETAFILGIFRPRIILPYNMKANDVNYVLAHEQAHLKRFDHIWKPLGFLLLTIYWFNPILWIAYIILCRDIEMACDEKVIKSMNAYDKKAYTTTLLEYSISRKMISVCPLAFGESGVESRIKSVLSYKKPTFWVIIVALIVLVGVGVGFLTNPESEGNTEIDEKLDGYISRVILENEGEHMKFVGEHYEDYYLCESHSILHVEQDKNETIVYAWVLIQSYDYSNGKIVEESGSHIPTAITVKESDGEYSLLEYWIPRDGTYYADDIRKKFPRCIHEEAFDSQSYVNEEMNNCEAKAKEYYANKYSDEVKAEDNIETVKKQILEGGYYEYPDTEGMHGNTIVDKCRIPKEILDIMTTEQLAQAVIDYPMLMIHFASSQAFGGTNMLQNASDAYRELLTRDDAKDILITQVKLHEVNVDLYVEIEYLKDIILDETKFVNILTDEDKEYLNSYLPDAKLLGYYEYPDVDFIEENAGINMCKISKELVENMTTEQLAQAVFEYPYIYQVAEAVKYPDSEYYSSDISDAYNEILKREDAEYELFRKVTKYDGIMALEYKVQAMKEILLFESKLNGNWTDEELEYLKNMQSQEKISNGINFKTLLVDISPVYVEKFKEDAINSESVGGGIEWTYPMQMFNTKKEFADFYNEYGDFGDGLSNLHPKFSEIQSKYDEDFFEENTLFIVYTYTGSYMIEEDVESMYVDDKQFSVYVDVTKHPEFVDYGGGDYFILIEVDKDDIKGCTEFGAYNYPIEE